jgi:hypothetical protein
MYYGRRRRSLNKRAQPQAKECHHSRSRSRPGQVMLCKSSLPTASYSIKQRDREQEPEPTLSRIRNCLNGRRAIISGETVQNSELPQLLQPGKDNVQNPELPDVSPQGRDIAQNPELPDVSPLGRDIAQNPELLDWSPSDMQPARNLELPNLSPPG